MTDPALVGGRTDARPDGELELSFLREQLRREREARQLAEHVAGHGVEELVREQREVALLAKVAVASNEGCSLSAVAEECLALVARHAGWPAATIWLRDDERSQLHPTELWYREPGEIWERLGEAVASRLTVPDGSLPGTVSTSGAPSWLEGLQLQTNWLRDEHDHELGVGTAFAVPIWAGRDIVGTVAMFHTEAVPRDDHLIELIEQVMTQLGVAIHRARYVETVHQLIAADGAPPVAAALVQLGEVAHLVRTPLHGLIGNLELLCESDLDTEQRELGVTALQSAIDLHRRLESWLEELDDRRPTHSPSIELGSVPTSTSTT